MSRMLQRISSHLEILVAPFALALAEGQWDGHLTGSLYALSPERLWCHLHRSKRYLGIRIAVVRHPLTLNRKCHQQVDEQQDMEFCH